MSFVWWGFDHWCGLATQVSTCLTGKTTKLAQSTAEFSVDADDFVSPRYGKTFYFTVSVKNAVKPSRLNGTATQGVELSPDPILQVFVECLANCGQLMNPSYRLVLSAQCKVCHNMSYTWQLDNSNNDSPVKRLLPRDTLNGLREPVINVNPNVFASANSETYDLVLTGHHRTRRLVAVITLTLE